MRRLLGSGLVWMGAIVVLGAIALWPGLNGGFLFDDFPNLATLGAYGKIDSLQSLARYLTSGIADPTGRPLSMLSFLIDARNWPADPRPFKLTNLLLHLSNGLLLFAALRELARAHGLQPVRAGRTAALAAALWMLHPLFVSTTMYIVQREAMLPATFGFATLWAWLVLRRRLQAGDRGALRRMACTIAIGTVLSTLSKSNGILLPALLLVVEMCLPRETSRAPGNGDADTSGAARAPQAAVVSQEAARLRTARRWLLGLPSCILLVPILASIPSSIETARTSRPWTLGERLLTEPRVVFDYIGQLLIPRPFSRGLFIDDFAVSHGLLDPWTTLPALLGLMAMAWLAWRLREKAPAVALAIGFYLVGQSVESGPIALELYFEHRNYLPAAMAFWPLAIWLTSEGSLPRLRAGVAFGLPLLLAALTWIDASLWGDSAQQAFVWGRRNPDSPRAQAYAAQVELNLGYADRAERRLRDALRKHPTELQLLVNLLGTRCTIGSVPQSDIDKAAFAFRTAPDPTHLASKWLNQALPTAESGSCRGFGIPEAHELAQAFADNPRTRQLASRMADSENLMGQVALAEGRIVDASNAFNKAFNVDRRVDVALSQAAMLASANQPRLALDQLAMASANKPEPWYRWRSMTDVNAWIMYRQGFWQQQIGELRGKIVADLGKPH